MTKLGLLCFIRSLLFAVFLPIGFFLRGFGVTKGAGNAILALAISFFFFYPIMLTMNYAIFKADIALDSETFGTAVWNSAVNCMKFMSLPLTVTLVTKAMGGVGVKTIGTDLLAWAQNTFPGNAGILRMASAGVNLFSVLSKWSTVLVLSYITVLSIGIFNAIHGMIYFLVKLILLYGLVLTAINIFATLTFARELSGILGTPIELSAFMKIL